MRNKVEELVEWVSSKILEYDGRGHPSSVKYGDVAKQILSHPDLALIDRDNPPTCMDCTGVPIIPLAEELKK